MASADWGAAFRLCPPAPFSAKVFPDSPRALEHGSCCEPPAAGGDDMASIHVSIPQAMELAFIAEPFMTGPAVPWAMAFIISHEMAHAWFETMFAPSACRLRGFSSDRLAARASLAAAFEGKSELFADAFASAALSVAGAPPWLMEQFALWRADHCDSSGSPEAVRFAMANAVEPPGNAGEWISLLGKCAFFCLRFKAEK